jgi:hypothetical protein
MDRRRIARWIAVTAMVLGLWTALFPFERPVPVGRPDLSSPLILETTPTIDCGSTIARIFDNERHDGACKNVARVRLVIAISLLVGGAVAVTQLKRGDLSPDTHGAQHDGV